MGSSTGSVLLNARWHSFAWSFAPQCHSVLTHHDHPSICPPWTPHQALLLSWLPTSCYPKLVIFPVQTPFSFIAPEPQLHPFRSHKSRLTTLEFCFAHIPVQNRSEIQGVSLPSLHHGWIVCSRVSWHRWDRSFNGSRWESVRLHSNHLIGVWFWFYLLSLLNHS